MAVKFSFEQRNATAEKKCYSKREKAVELRREFKGGVEFQTDPPKRHNIT